MWSSSGCACAHWEDLIGCTRCAYVENVPSFRKLVEPDWWNWQFLASSEFFCIFSLTSSRCDNDNKKNIEYREMEYLYNVAWVTSYYLSYNYLAIMYIFPFKSNLFLAFYAYDENRPCSLLYYRGFQPRAQSTDPTFTNSWLIFFP